MSDAFSDERRMVEALARDLGRASSPSAFHARAAKRFHELSGSKSATFFAPEPDSEIYAAVASSTAALDRDLRFARRGPLVKWLRVNEEPLLLREHPEIVAYLPVEEQNQLMSVRAAACVPLMTGRLQGFIVLSEADRPMRLAPGLVRLLAACARQAAVVSESITREHGERVRLEAASRAQQLAATGQIASAVAHEVRNPLATIRSSVQFVLDSKAAWEDKSDLLRQVIAEVDRINRTLSGMLVANRRLDLALGDLDVRRLVDAVLELFAPHFAHHHLTLERCDVPQPLPVSGDAEQLRQLLVNLLLNACQATPDGGRISISSSTCRNAMGAPLVRIDIADTGCGMTPQQISRLFEPFYSTKVNGTGLGLSICHDIVKAHHGEIAFDSQAGAGTTVRVTLPMRES